MFDLYPDATAASLEVARQNPAVGVPLSFGESFGEAWTAQRAYQQSVSLYSARADVLRDLLQDYRAKTGEDIGNPLVKGVDENGMPVPSDNQWMDPTINFRTRYEETRKARPELGLPAFPTDEQIDATAIQRMTAARQHYDETQRRNDHGVADFLGGAAGSVTDPVNLGAMALGAPAASGIVRTMLIEGALGAASQGLVTGLNYDTRKLVEPGYGPGQAAEEILTAGAGGAVLGGALKGLSRLLEHVNRPALTRSENDALNVAARDDRINETSPFPTDPVANALHRDTVEDVATALRMSDTAPVRITPEADALAERGIRESLPIEREFDLSGPVERSAPTLGESQGPVVYHGSLSLFDQFDAAHLGKESGTPAAKEGFFFTSDPDIARGYAKVDAYGDSRLGRIMPKRIVNGLAAVGDAVARLFGQKPLRAEGQLITAKLNTGKVMEVDMGGRGVDQTTIGAYVKDAKKRGYDSVQFKNMADGGYDAGASETPSDVWVVFDPKNIRILDHGAPNMAVKGAADLERAGFTREPGDDPFWWAKDETTASWVIREKATGNVIMETFDKKKVDALNTEKYEAVPIAKYLGSLNQRPTADPLVGGIAATHLTEDAMRKAAAEPDADLAAVHLAEHMAGVDPFDPNNLDFGIETPVPKFVRPPRVKQPPSLLDFLVRIGLKDDGGELRQAGLDNFHIPFKGRLVRKDGRGLTLDMAREAAVEAGYLRDAGWNNPDVPAQTTVSDLIEAMKADHAAYTGKDAGSRVYSEADEGAAADFAQAEQVKREEEKTAAFTDMAKADGHDVSDRKLMEYASAYYFERGGNVDDAIERAAIAIYDEAQAGHEALAEVAPGVEHALDLGTAPAAGGESPGAGGGRGGPGGEGNVPAARQAVRDAGGAGGQGQAKPILIRPDEGGPERDLRDILREADEEEAMAKEIGNCVIGKTDMPE